MSDAEGAVHPEESLSAYLDGGLDPAERAAVAEHLRTCASCRARLEELRSVRDVVRQLPVVDPPFGFVEELLRLGPRPRSGARGRRWRLLSAAVVAVVALVMIVGVARRELGGVHVDVAQVADRFQEIRPSPRGVAAGPEPGALPSWAPAHLGPLEPSQVVAGDGDRAVLYGVTPGAVALSAHEGELPDGAPDEGDWSRAAVGDDVGWATTEDGVTVLVVERGDHVYTLVGRQPAADLAALAASLPDQAGGSSLGDRVTAIGRGVLDAFGFG